jgi:hypothetical protein
LSPKITPLQLQPVDEKQPFDNPDWVFELKHDEFRARAYVTWTQTHYRRMSDGDLLRKFEELAQKEKPFDPAYPVVPFKPD